MTTCANCRHSRKHDARAVVDIGRGESLQCWRFPPVPVGGPAANGMAVGTFRPLVSSGDSCGEFAEKPAASH